MKQFFEKLLGIDKLKQEALDTIKAAEEAKRQASELVERAEEVKRIANQSPKEIATEKKEPWVAVLETHVNKDNVRNGFFELDWNEYFVVQLRGAGYTGSTDEEVVDQWFNELCRSVGGDEGIDMSRRGAGYVNRALRDDGKTEVS
jgi:hypothetical protein